MGGKYNFYCGILLLLGRTGISVLVSITLLPQTMFSDLIFFFFFAKFLGVYLIMNSVMYILIEISI